MEVLSSPFFQRALAAGLLAAVACGIAGTYVVIKEMASISGGLAHAAFGGLGLGYALGFSPMLGAAGFSLLSGLGVGLAHRRLHQGLDTLIMMMWSVGMALGILLVAAVPGYAPDLASFLFGNLLFVTPTYVMLAGALDLLLLLAVVLLHRQLQAVAVDEEYAEVMGLPVDGLVLLLMGLVSLVVVLLIRVVGVLLVVALLTIPAAVARHWARTLGRMMVLATAVAAGSVVAGLLLSAFLGAQAGLDLPSGPLVVLVAGAAYGASLWLRRTGGGGGAAGAGGAMGAGASTAGTALLATGGAALLAAALLAPAGAAAQEPPEAAERPRAREAGVIVGRMPPGPHNAITDLEGVRVGHHTLWRGDSLRTGVTAILPHGGDLFRRKVPAAVAVGNGFGKLVGLSQVNELGEIETPILLTGTLSVFRAADALVDTLLADPAHRDVRSINPVVGETNDGWLSDIRARPIDPEHVRAALRDADGGPVEEGSVGAGTGTTALGWKGGVGTASRRVRGDEGAWTVGVLVQTNYGGELTVVGVPVGRELGRNGYREGTTASASVGPPVGDSVRTASASARPGDGPAGAEKAGERATADRPGRAERMAVHDARSGGSVMIVVATDAPLAHNELRRLAGRAFLGIARTGSWMSHGSGDYAIAFSTRPHGEPDRRLRDGGALSSLFRAAVEATEEAVLNSLFRATTVTGQRGRTAEALPVERVREILREHGRPGPDAGGAAAGPDDGGPDGGRSGFGGRREHDGP